MKHEGVIHQLQHRIEYWYDIGRYKHTDEMKEVLEESAESRSKELIIEGYRTGELNCLWKDEEIRGWWKIA